MSSLGLERDGLALRRYTFLSAALYTWLKINKIRQRGTCDGSHTMTLKHAWCGAGGLPVRSMLGRNAS